jgi:hypothetical protein
MTRQIFSTLVLVCFVSILVNPQGKQATTPNVYELAGGHLKITYSRTSEGLKLTYRTGSQTMSFQGNEIQETESAVGNLVTVTTHMTIDTGSTTFTLLVPTMRLDGVTPAPVHTVGITTVHKFSVVPAFNRGQTELYTTTELTGTAKFVPF